MASKTAVCPVCGESHPVAQSELFFQRPDVIFEMRKDQREELCSESDELCVLSGKGPKGDRHFVRAVLPLPVSGRERPYRIGVWVETTKKDFARVVDLWAAEDQAQEPPFPGKLANQLPLNQNTVGLKVKLQLAGPTQRPAVFVADSRHPLFEEQAHGITAHRAYEYTPQGG
jgi:hypothetical protein